MLIAMPSIQFHVHKACASIMRDCAKEGSHGYLE